jgi:hypothetical protein
MLPEDEVELLARACSKQAYIAQPQNVAWVRQNVFR